MTATVTTSADTTTEQSAVLAVLQEHVDALHAGDGARALATFAPDASCYTLPPPLEQVHGGFGDPSGLQGWLDSFADPVTIAFRDPTVHVDGDVAFVFALTRMSGRKHGDAAPFALWFRSTYGLRRVEGPWRIVHQHESVPFLMDGSFAAAVGLTPEDG